MCVNKWPNGVGQPRSPRSQNAAILPIHLCASSGFLPTLQRGQSNFPKLGIHQGPASPTHQSLKDEEESASLVFVELPPIIPGVSGLHGKYAVVWQAMRLFEGNLNQRLYFSVCNIKRNYSIHNRRGISTQVSLFFCFLAQSHMFSVNFFFNCGASPHLTWQQ